MRVIEMNFLPDVYVHCEKCNGKRYNRETLEIRYKGKSISDVLDMSVDEAVEFFQNVPYIYRKIKVLQEVGLGYITLGQSAVTLSDIKISDHAAGRTRILREILFVLWNGQVVEFSGKEGIGVIELAFVCAFRFSSAGFRGRLLRV